MNPGATGSGRARVTPVNTVIKEEAEDNDSSSKLVGDIGDTDL